MQFKRWVSWIAVAGILLHAAAVARHNVIMLQAIPAEVASLAGLEPGVICQVDSEAGKDGKAHGLPGSGQGHASKPCPVCMGLVSAHALTPSEAPALRVPQTLVALTFLPPDRQIEPLRSFRLPSNRGPPSIA